VKVFVQRVEALRSKLPAAQEDGKILVGGPSSLRRLNANGTWDTNFNPGPGGGGVYSVAVQPDHKILVGGFFTSLGGQACRCIGRLNEDGSWDVTFTAETLDAGTFTGDECGIGGFKLSRI